MRIMRGLGERESIGTTSTGEDLTRMNELSATPAALDSHIVVPYPGDAGVPMSIISESAQDGPAGTGVDEVTLEVIDPDGSERTIVVAMNGQTTVPIDGGANIRFVNDMYSTALGSGASYGGVAAGHIRVYETADATMVFNMIAAGGNKSLVPHRLIPAGFDLYLKEWICAEGNNKRLTMRLRADCNNDAPPVRQSGVFLFKSVVYCNQSTSGAMPLAYCIPELSVVKVSAWASAINGEASVHWWGILVKK